MRVNWFIPVNHRDYNRMPASVWIRCLQLIPYLEQKGIQSRVNQPEHNADIAVFVRCQDASTWMMAKSQKAKGMKTVFDLCVNYLDETGLFNGRYGAARERVEEAMRMLEVADGVTCASRHIAEQAQREHECVETLPDSIDAAHMNRIKNVEDFYRDRIRAIWSGVSVKGRELQPLLPLLRELAIDLVIVSDQRPGLTLGGWLWKRRMPFRYIHWRYERFPLQILEGEVCISYRVVDNPYDRGHSMFKVGVFMSEGVPAVASPVPSYEEILADGTCGQICCDLSEWRSALERMQRDRDVLTNWSKQARKTMEAFSTEKIAARYAAFFRALLG